jgi:leucyl aminopeptidase
MLKINTKKTYSQLNADLLCLYTFESAQKPEKLDSLDAKLKAKILESLKAFSFKAKPGTSLLIEGTKTFDRVLIIGLGKKRDFDADGVRSALGQAVKEANKLRVDSLVSPIPAGEKFLAAGIEGMLTADYQFKGLFRKEDKDKKNTLTKATIISIAVSASKTVDDLQTVFKAVNNSKDLVNLPSNIVTPTYLEKVAREIAKNKKVELQVLTEEDAKKEKMGAFLAVARGSVEPARMIVLRYNGNPKSKTVYGVIGKGITFDSGGISLKPASGMGLMKTDMAGSAAAIGAFDAVVDLGLKLNLIAVIAAAENMPGGNACRPGDIVTASNGKTIEVVNTDAEGRMVLADALVYAQKLGANKIIDMATLTGACIVTFGDFYTGLMSNDDQWADAFLQSSVECGEKAWKLPMDKAYNALIKSDICDMVNASEARKAGTIMGGKFLEQFVEKSTKWIHLDIAGTAYMDTPTGYQNKFATAVPLRTIVNLLKQEIKGKF